MLGLGKGLVQRAFFFKSFSSATTATGNTADKTGTMTWTQFFEHRRARRRWELAGGLLGGLGGLGGGGYYFFCVADFDPTQPLLGLPDPTIAYVGGALAVGGLSLAGGLMGAGALWRLSTKRFSFFLLL
jgi:hypothetical protein